MDRRSGQVGIVLLLITVVMLTVGLSAASRTVLDVSVSRTGENANRALDAAESGVEEALSQDLNSFNSGTGGSTADINVNTTVNRSATLETRVEPTEVVGVNTTGVPAGQSLTINWAKETVCTTQASLMISIYNNSGGVVAVRRQYAGVRAGACTARNTADGFSASQGSTSAGFNISVAVPLLTNDTLVRIRPIYAGTDLRISGGAWLTTQMFTVSSSAQSTLGKETKAVQVNRSLPVAPAIFDNVLYSGGAITQ